MKGTGKCHVQTRVPKPEATGHKAAALIMGLLSISIGGLFYAAARQAGSEPWDGLILGAVWGSFPSFVHVLGLSFLTLATLPARRGVIFAIGAGWLACNAVYELASHAVFDGAAGRSFTGDPLDVTAAAAGALTFWLGASLAFLSEGRIERREQDVVER